MKNVTVTFDEETAQRAHSAAAKAGTSMSRYLAEAAREKIARDEAAESKTNVQREALERLFAGPKWDVTQDGRMPSAEERNARR